MKTSVNRALTLFGASLSSWSLVFQMRTLPKKRSSTRQERPGQQALRDRQVLRERQDRPGQQALRDRQVRQALMAPMVLPPSPSLLLMKRVMARLTTTFNGAV